MATGDRSISDVLQDVLRNLQEIVRSEVKLAKTEIREQLVNAKTGGVLLALGAVCGISALFLVILASVYALALVVPHWAAALIVAALLAIVAAIVVFAGWKQIKRIHPAPEKTVETIKENVAWAKRQVR